MVENPCIRSLAISISISISISLWVSDMGGWLGGLWLWLWLRGVGDSMGYSRYLLTFVDLSDEALGDEA